MSKLTDLADRATPKVKRRAAWGVHAFTATGVIFGFLALKAVYDNEPQTALFWLGVALLVDGLDGPLARLFRVKDVLPRMDGTALDLVVDYLNYVVVPAAFLHQFALLPGGTETVAAAYILGTSLYTFVNLDMKTNDYYFTGFPAVWNVVAVFFFILKMPPFVNLTIVAILGAMTFSQLKFTHPLRVRSFRVPTVAMTAMWLGTSALLVAESPERSPVVLLIWGLTCLYFVGLCGWRSLRGPADDA